MYIIPWKRRPSGENVLTPRSAEGEVRCLKHRRPSFDYIPYSERVKNMFARCYRRKYGEEAGSSEFYRFRLYVTVRRAFRSWEVRLSTI